MHALFVAATHNLPGRPPQVSSCLVCFALCLQLLDHPEVSKMFPSDVIDRAKVFLSDIPGGIGAYSDSAGALVLRQQIAEALERRDGWPANPDEIYLTVCCCCMAGPLYVAQHDQA
jgi:hypothetical protein